jgi:lysyl-tRNA synthetase class 1
MVVVDELGDSLANMAYEFMLKRDVLEKQVKDTAEAAPLYALITQEIMADDRVVAKIGSVKDDPFGRLFVQAKSAFSFSAPWLSRTYDQLFKKHQIVPESIASWTNRHKLFDDMGLLIQGIQGWLQGDNVKAVHLLVPQVEYALRKIADDIGLPVTKAHLSLKGVSVAINMGDILYAPEILAALGENLTLHFQALYSDPRGLNLRNELAHGLMDSSDFGDHMIGLIIHSLLMLGVWKELGNAARRKKLGGTVC